MDFLLDTTTNDLDLTAIAGDVVTVDGPQAILQQLRIRFQFFKGEWFLDTRQGVPWFEEILIKNPGRARLAFIFRQVLLTTPGVASVVDFEMSEISTNRALTLKFRLRLSSGEILDSSAYGPFIIDLSTLV